MKCTSLLIVFACLFGSSEAVFGQGDDCGSASVIGGEGAFLFDSSGASTSGFDGTGVCGLGSDTFHKDVFWQWTAPFAGDFVFDTFGSGFDTQLSVHAGAGCAAICTVYNDQANFGNQSEVMLSGVLSGTVYLIQVGGFGLESGAGVLNITHAIDPCAVADDTFEDNDDCASPAVIGVGSHTGLYVESGDSDFYEFVIPTGNIFELLEVADSNACDYRLWDAGCGALLLSGIVDGFTYPNVSNAPKTVVIEAFQWSGASSPCSNYAFDLSTSVNPCALVADDVFEDNDDCASAVPIGVGTYSGLFVRHGDSDFFEFTLPPGMVLLVAETQDTGDTRYELRRSGCSTLLLAGGTAGITWANTTGTSQVVVMEAYLRNNASVGCCDYGFGVSTYSDPCQNLVDDIYEDNDHCATAAPMVDGFYTGLNVHREDSDFYSFCVPAQGAVSVDLSFLSIAGDLDIYLWDALNPQCDYRLECCSWLAGGFSSTNDEHIAWSNNDSVDRAVVLEVRASLWGFSDCNEYDMLISGAVACNNPGFAYPFCYPETPYAVGEIATLTATMQPAAGSGVHLNVSFGPPNQFGYFLVGSNSAEPGIVVSEGRLCFDLSGANMLGRYNSAGTALNSVGQFSAAGVFVNLAGTSTVGTGFDVPSALPFPGMATIVTGDVWHFQLWHREPGGLSNFSNGLTVLF